MQTKLRIQLFNDDCIIKMKELEQGSIDLIIADPPYWKVIGEKWDGNCN